MESRLIGLNRVLERVEDDGSVAKHAMAETRSQNLAWVQVRDKRPPPTRNDAERSAWQSSAAVARRD